MNRRITNLCRLLRPLPLLLALAGAQAASLRLEPAAGAAAVGATVDLALWMDFSDDPTLGGGVDLVFDATLLQPGGFSFDAGFADDPAFRRLPDAGAGVLSGLAFGHFNGLPGPARVGSYSLQVLAPGLATLTLAVNAEPVGGFYSAVSFGPQAPGLSGAALQLAPVPEPAAAALWLLGLAALAGLRGCRPGSAPSA